MTADGPWRAAARLAIVFQADIALSEFERMTLETHAAQLAASLAAAGVSAVERPAVTPYAAWAACLPQRDEPACDLLLLDRATSITAEAVLELRRVIDSDPMIVATSPRFAAKRQDWTDEAAPEVSYTLLPDHRAIYLKGSVLADVAAGLAVGSSPLDPVGFVLALNCLGFRATVAGRALALHPEGPVTHSRPPLPPEWRQALARQRGSAPAAAQTLLAGLQAGPDGRRAIAFDLAHVGPTHSGTSNLARALVERAAAQWGDCAIHVVASQAAFAFHFAAVAEHVSRIDPADRRIVAAVIRIGQPFLWKELDAAVRRAPVLVLFMLDTIGLDCLSQAPDELDALWRLTLAEADGLLFNSAFTGRQFARRFTLRPGMPTRTSLHSLDVADYRTGAAIDFPEGRSILVVGNAMPHKRLRDTATLLAASGLADPVVVLGLPAGSVPGVSAVPSGGISADRMRQLYGAARIVVYPSIYEGFGFPILEALAQRRPILVRPLAPYAEILAGLPEAANVHTFADDADLVHQLAAPPAWTEARAETPVRNWDDAVSDLRAVLDEAIGHANLDRVVRRIDALRGRMAYMRTRAFVLADPDDPRAAEAVIEDLDRLAGMAGRITQSFVAAVGRHIPIGRALLGALGRRLRPR